MNQFLFLLIVLACPLMMVFMMRSMHGGHGEAEHAQNSVPQVVDTTAQDARIAALEHEVARLRAEGPQDDDPDPAFVDELHGQLDKQLVGPRP
jgi:hypothetical protein